MNVFKTQEFANVGIDFTHDHEYVSTIINMHFVIRTPGMFSSKGALKSADSDSFNRNLSVLLRLQELDRPDDLGL